MVLRLHHVLRFSVVTSLALRALPTAEQIAEKGAQDGARHDSHVEARKPADELSARA